MAQVPPGLAREVAQLPGVEFQGAQVAFLLPFVGLGVMEYFYNQDLLELV